MRTRKHEWNGPTFDLLISPAFFQMVIFSDEMRINLNRHVDGVVRNTLKSLFALAMRPEQHVLFPCNRLKGHDFIL